MSRLTALANGSAARVADELSDQPATIDDLRYALINALDRIEQLENQVANLRKELAE